MQTSTLMSDLKELLPYLSKQELDELLIHIAAIEKEEQIWKPLPGPQTQAYHSKADILFYGGAAGGGKTDLLLGLAHTAHTRSIIFRREYPQLKAIEDRAKELFKKLGEYNKSDKVWQFFDGRRQIEFGAVKDAGDEEKFQGRAHDLKGFDEITHFLYSQFLFLITWTRSANVSQRTRIVCTGNPPTSAEGDWVLDFWGPWLDEKNPRYPLEPGRLLFFTNIDGQEVEMPNGEPIEHKGEIIVPKSRTFIPASIEDNPYLLKSGYKAMLQSLPKVLRDKYLLGNFSAGREDDPWQVIPSDWVLAAQERWKQRPKPQMRLNAIGTDIARGGADMTVLTLRYGNWFDEQLAYPGSSTPNGPSVAALVLQRIEEGTRVNLDIIGVGSSVYDILQVPLGERVVAMNGAAASDATDRTGQLGFINKRAEWYWKLREALDPETGDELALPPTRELMADLCAPRWELTTRGVKIESKEDVKKRLGRSTDYGDSFVYAHAIEINNMALGSF